jgi:TPR repeat protein
MTTSLISRALAALTALAGTALAACGTADPALRQGLAEMERHPGQARVTLRPLAERGDEAAITQICIAYGRSMDYQVRPKEREQAFAWCRHAGPAGNAEAQFTLGRFYAWGIGTPEDPVEALHWYRRAALQGHEEAEDAARGMEGKPKICRNFITGCRLF